MVDRQGESATTYGRRVVPNRPVLVLTILVYGVVSGAVGGYPAVKVWKRNLKARFQAQS